jgi:membrane-associated phospholipid phosphatase
VVRRGEIVAVVGGSLLLASSWLIVAVDSRVPDWEASLFRDINGLGGWLWPVVRLPMQLGGFVGSLVVVGLTGLVSRNGRLTMAALAGSQAAYWTAKGLKSLVSRGRPDVLLAGVHVREHATGLGYVSGHTAVAFSLAAVLIPSLPHLWQRVAVALAAAVVAFARVYGGVHLPLDVIGGAGLGLLCGTFSRWLLGLGGEGMAPRAEPARG